MLDAVGPGSQTAPGRKRSRDLYESLTKIIAKHVNNKPGLLPKRQPSESELLAQYHANKVKQQEPSQRSSAAFQYSPHRKPVPTPSIFSPATSKVYASPVNGTGRPGASPGIPPAPSPAQQQGLFGRSPTQPVTTTPLHGRLNHPPSRLGPSRMMAQRTTPPLRMQYLNSAPAVAVSPAEASPRPIAGSSHTTNSTTHQTPPTYGSYIDSPASNAMPHNAHHDSGFVMDGHSAEDQWQDAASSPEFDRMFGQGGSNGQQPGFQKGLAEHAPSSQQSEGPADSPVAGGPQHLKVNASKQDAIKRLAAKRATLSGFASPVPSLQSPSRAGLHHSTLFGSLLKRKASQALAEETWPKASRQRMENALTGISKAEEAAQQESAAARTPSRPRPPTAVLGFAPPSQASPSTFTVPASGKHSWPAHFFDDSRKKRRTADSEQESAAGSGHQDESVDTGAVSSCMGNGDSMAGDGLDKDFGAAWRDAAQSPLPSQCPAPAPDTEDTPQVTSPPFAAASQQQQQPSTSGGLPDPASPSPTPSATPTPPLAPPTAFGKPFGTPQHTPVGPPQASIFAFAASPATVPVKGRHEGSSSGDHMATGNPLPAMFSAATRAAAAAAADNNDVASHRTPPTAGLDAAAPASDAASPANRGAGLLADGKAAEGASGKENEAASKPAVSGWGAALLAGNQAAAAKTAEAIAEAVKENQTPSKHVDLQSRQAGAVTAAGSTMHSTTAITSAAAAALAPMPIRFGVLPPAQTGSGSSQQGTEASTSAAAVPAPLPLSFGVPPSAQAVSGSAHQSAEASTSAAAAPTPMPAFIGLPPFAQADSGGMHQGTETSTSAAAPAPTASELGVVSSAPAASGSWHQSTDANRPAVPMSPMSGPFKFGVALAGTTAQTSSPPMAIPAAKYPAATPDGGENSLGRDGSWMSISPKSFETRQQEAGPVLASTSQPQVNIGPASGSAASGTPSSAAAAGPFPGTAAFPLSPSMTAHGLLPQVSFGASNPAFGGAASTTQQPPLHNQPPPFSLASFGNNTGTAPSNLQPSPSFGYASFGSMPMFGQQQQQQQTSSAGFGQQASTGFSAFGPQPHHGAPPPFNFGQSAAGGTQSGSAPFQAIQQPALPVPAAASQHPAQQSTFAFNAATANGQPPFGAQPAAGLLAAPAGQGQAGSAQPSAFPAPSSIANFTLGAANNDSRPSSGTGPRRKVLRKKHR